MPINPTDVTELLERLASHANSENNDDVLHWREIIHKQFALTQQITRQVVFIGEVGVGKSSALAVTANLLLDGERPHDKPSLRKQSMLPTGAGRTTLCEVAIRAHQGSENSNEFGLLLHPISKEEMQESINLWVEDEWNKQKSNSANGTDGDTQSNSQETTRALRNMAGYADQREAGGSRRINPLPEVVSQYESSEALKKHLLERIRLNDRTQVEWWLPSDSARTKVKELLEQVNNGTCPTALLPCRVTLVIPNFMSELGELASQLQFIDTRGLDAGVRLSARADLQRFIEDPLAIYVLCSPFKSAPGDAIREVLREVDGDARWRDANQRMIVALLDHPTALDFL